MKTAWENLQAAYIILKDFLEENKEKEKEN